jgi:hypothetical protein
MGWDEDVTEFRKDHKMSSHTKNSTSAEVSLLSVKDTAISAMGALAQEFKRLGLYHYEEMVREQQAAICGAVITVQGALNRSTYGVEG